MILKVGGKQLKHYNSLSVTLSYDTVASTFGFDFLFDPDNPDHREIFRPGRFAPVTVEHEGEVLITGTLLANKFTDESKRQLTGVSGYSRPGVLEDCEIPTEVYPLQSDGLTLEQIAQKVIKPFGIALVVDSAVSAKVRTAYKTSTASDQQSVKGYLAELAGQKHVILTHDEKGNLVLTQAKTTAAPIYDFNTGMPGVKMELDFNGQNMHSSITLIKQQTKGRKDGSHKKGNAGKSTVSNPYAADAYRPKVNRQTSGENVDTSNAARNMLSDELKSLSLKIYLDRWTLNGKLVRPNNIITVYNPYVHLYKKTRLFISDVDFKGDQAAQTAVLTCVLPAVFSSENPEYIFA